jgi:N-acetylmuramoyl-L-alanine amidase
VTSLPSFEYCSLFGSGKWETVEENGVPKFRLALTLRQAGIYSGCGAYYDENGDLMLTFAVPTASLSGKVIVIDPGHGYGKTSEKLDPGAIGNVTEQSVTYAVSKALEDKLTAIGATVVRLKTESEFILTETRPTVARNYGADMYISLHCNSSTNETAHGVEVYYFTSFSQPLASAINSQLSSYYDYSVYGDGTSSSRGAKYSYYWVTLQQDFPSVLVEMGFISNERECMIMANSTYQAGIAGAIANGIYDYFARSTLTYYGSGSSSQTSPDEIIELDPSASEETPAEEITAPETGESHETTAPAETIDASTAENTETIGASDNYAESAETAPETDDSSLYGGIRVE